MTDTVKLDLSSRFEPFGRLIAEWWEEDSKFVVVHGSTKHDHQDFNLRLDLDKRVFLDHLKNKTTDDLIQKQAQEISRLVWSERQRRSYAAAYRQSAS